MDLNLSDAVVSLEIGAVVICIPETELHEAEEFYCFCLVCGVLESDVIEEGVVIDRDEHLLSSGYSVLAAFEDAVAHAVTALITVKLCLDRLPGRVPDDWIICLFVVFCFFPDVESEAFLVQRIVVVAVARDAAQSGILVEGIAAGGVGDQGEEIPASQVVDPWKRGLWGFDYILSFSVVEVSESHRFVLYLLFVFGLSLRSLPLRPAGSRRCPWGCVSGCRSRSRLCRISCCSPRSIRSCR